MHRYSKDENPYNRGCMGNCMEVFCTRLQPSRFRFRATAGLYKLNPADDP